MKYLLLLCTILSGFNSATAARLYVSTDGTPANSGTSWSQTTSLHRALNSARPGDEIWVRLGRYVTSPAGNRAVAFTVPAGVKLYGGFLGHERSLEQRQPATQSTLCGELGEAGQDNDNAYTVVILKSSAALAATLDGFLIRSGRAHSYTEDFSPANAGGGIYLHSASPNSPGHRINNCTFSNNSAHNGGAVFINGGRPLFSNCRFDGNDADFNGGAVYNCARTQAAYPQFRQCTFVNNASNSGGGITNYGVTQVAQPSLIGCSFVDNVSLMNGAAMANILSNTGTCNPNIASCTFNGNASILGQDITTIGPGAARNTQSPAGRVRGSTLRPVRSK